MYGGISRFRAECRPLARSEPTRDGDHLVRHRPHERPDLYLFRDTKTALTCRSNIRFRHGGIHLSQRVVYVGGSHGRHVIISSVTYLEPMALSRVPL